MNPLSALLTVVTGALVTTLGLVGTATAADLSFRGTFDEDDDVHLFDFSVETDSTVTFITYSYGGGTQADDNTVEAGGFDPVLTLFDNDGKLIDESDDDTLGIVATDPTTGKAYDSLLQIDLMAGDYTLALTQYDNFVNTPYLSDGFNQEGNGNFTSSFSGCSDHDSFCDFTGDGRTNEWAFDAIGVEPLIKTDNKNPDGTQVPEPGMSAAFALVGLGLLVRQHCHQ